MKRIFFFVFLLAILAAIDQLFKFLSEKYFQGGIFVIKRFFSLDYFQNYGVAFGLRLSPFLFYTLVVFLLYFIFEKFKTEIKKKDFFLLLAISFIVAGAASNLIDRLSRGFVIDYLFIYPMSYFNLADLSILIGVIMIGWKEIRY